MFVVDQSSALLVGWQERNPPVKFVFQKPGITRKKYSRLNLLALVKFKLYVSVTS